ncbi:hypothetical protein [Kribbella jiaozuonensis]|uniref:Uncharacterized protein n=1 Tax=Kribbella jiaozuonensis TaxID=2575441 RepID=A0A4U3LT29_9ACTN|nr:hypothetical protein [Kribbella jiaozuonensis]TKK79178.1 hypothetical protein FDA38_12160 [Kribbella jiaozuonensis]TKK83248.1 hypothetical protein FDA38_11115 [Kribbella jiaozuonensis]
MELTGSDFDEIRREHLRGVRRHDFALVWLAAEERADALAAQGREDGYLAGVVSACRWIANAGVRYAQPINGRRGELARSPISRKRELAIEESIEAEALEAERLHALRRESIDPPGYVAGVHATFGWTWRRSGQPPLEVPGRLAG